MLYFVGVDPGKSGAIAMINEIQDVILLEDWPGDEVQAAKLIWRICDLVDRTCDKILGAIEKIHAMPMIPIKGQGGMKGMSSTASFTFGAGWGIWKGIFAACEIPFLEPRPQDWMKGVFKKSDGKVANMAAAARTFPSAQIYGPRGGKKDGRADALLIADWRRRQMLQ